ncbi:flagellar biosynthetic protein FliQ [Endozoicomonas sp. SM1973]|uniref:Flagellar biosynthetic protein FliQ n=2 Tax=Spartinivicinus marinus TaxID=2994442 RepID=A0A853IFA3_9GAMM|nr:flagellar biosynthetic protein FliQ [Spartinivicinus marinus]
MLTSPPLIIAIAAGVLTSLVQTLTQIQDQTLPFAIKLVTVGVTLALTGRWIGGELIQLMSLVFSLISFIGR